MTLSTCSTCPTCPTEPVAIQIAIQNGMDEYLIHKDNRHKRKRLDGSVVTNATYEIEYWHGVVRAAKGEGAGDGV